MAAKSFQVLEVRTDLKSVETHLGDSDLACVLCDLG